MIPSLKQKILKGFNLNKEEIIKKGKEVISIESRSVSELINSIDDQFYFAIEKIFNCKGRVVLTGMGKSGLIARKIVATLNSTGTPAFYLHPTDALHGDLGMVRKEDVVILLSKSGATEELLNLISILKRMEVLLIGMLGESNSRIGREVDIILNVHVEEEACPFHLAPTSSTTATLVMGDALAVCLLQKRGFTQEDFAMLHPGGSLGKRLSLKVSEIMVKDSGVPVVNESTSVKDAILEMTTKRLGLTCVVNGNNILKGIITDGDLRRTLEIASDISNFVAKDIMTKKPKVISQDELASSALQTMENFKITSLIVADAGKPVGIVHLHDLVNLGLKMR